MKLINLLFLCIALVALKQNNAQTTNPNNTIQLALLLDVSGSMEGLINQAKTELWTIVNEVAKAKKDNENARLEIALYEYGRQTNDASKGYVKKLLDYTSDLDTISQVLFSLHTNGGEEYCGWVIDDCLKELQWRDNKELYKVIFIAGNENFDQGVVNYNTACSNASEKDIIVNTIHCGDSFTGVKGYWANGAEIGNGKYFFINHNSNAYNIKTPFDSVINNINDSLNTTYWAFGDNGKSYYENQKRQDDNALYSGADIKAKRAFSKTNKVYDNKKWDVVDANKNDSNFFIKTKDKDLPDELKGKTIEEKKKLVKEKTMKRESYSKEIQNLSIKREEYIKKLNTTNKDNTLGSALIKAIREQASSKGFVFE